MGLLEELDPRQQLASIHVSLRFVQETGESGEELVTPKFGRMPGVLFLVPSHRHWVSPKTGFR